MSIIEDLGKFVKAYFWPRGYLDAFFEFLKLLKVLRVGGRSAVRMSIVN
jgi:hypothetical protein